MAEENKIKGKIKAVSEPREFQGKLQIGFMIDKKWYNIDGKLQDLEELLNNFIKKGNVVEFNFEENKVLDLTLVSEAEEGESWQDDIVNFETLLDQAHKHGLKEIETEKLEVDLGKKYALFKATVSGAKGEFSGHGDATEENVTGDFIKPHFIRMAETRAICRALRWYTNNATCAEEEKSKTKKKKIKEKINKTGG